MSTNTSPVTIHNAAPREPKDFTQWLTSLGLECYIEAFQNEHIDFKTLQDLDENNLKELGVSVGHRVKLKKAIQEILEPNQNHNQSQNQTPASPTASPTDLVDEEDMFEIKYKVIVVGDVGTGKTSLIQRYTSGTFDDRYKATIGVDFCLKEIQWNRETMVNVQLWDIAGQERFASLTRMYYREAKGAFLVFDVARDKTFDAVLKWKADIDAKVTLPNGKVIPVILLANKCDLLTSPIDLDEFCKEHGFDKWFKTSAKENIGIDEASQYLVKRMMENDEITSAPAEAPTKGINMKQNNAKSTKSGCCS